MRSAIRRRGVVPVLIAVAIVAAIGVALILRAEAPPEAARLLPESDAILFVQLKLLRAATHLDQNAVQRSPEFQHFIDATGIVPERDLDSAAFAVHRMPNPNGPNGPVAYSEVFTGRFDGVKLAAYLQSIAQGEESYAGHTIYDIPIEGRTLRITQVGYDTVAASNMPTAEQIHSMLDRSRASALSTPGSSLLAARFHEVPLLSQAWGIGRIGLPFSDNGQISVMGLELPVPSDTDLVASLRFTGAVKLRVEEFAPDTHSAQTTADSMNALLAITKGLAGGSSNTDASAGAVRAILDSASVTQKEDHVLLTAEATLDQIKALATAHSPANSAADSLTSPASSEAAAPSKK